MVGLDWFVEVNCNISQSVMFDDDTPAPSLTRLLGTRQERALLDSWAGQGRVHRLDRRIAEQQKLKLNQEEGYLVMMTPSCSWLSPPLSASRG